MSELQKAGWVDETFREPPDNRERALWTFYGPLLPYVSEGGVRHMMDNAIAMIYEQGSNDWGIRCAGPLHEPPRKKTMTTSLRMNGTLQEAKDEAQTMLRDLGWTLTTARGAPVKVAA